MCEISFQKNILTLKNEAFVRDLLQKRSFENPKRHFDAQKRSFSARLPSEMQLWSSKTKLLCETSFKNETVMLKNEAFLQDFLQKCNFEDQKRSISARLPSKLTCWPDTWPQNSNNYSLRILNWMLQKYCACHEKVGPRHTNSCNCHAKWSLQIKWHFRNMKFATLPRILRRGLHLEDPTLHKGQVLLSTTCLTHGRCRVPWTMSCASYPQRAQAILKTLLCHACFFKRKRPEQNGGLQSMAIGFATETLGFATVTLGFATVTLGFATVTFGFGKEHKQKTKHNFKTLLRVANKKAFGL